VNEIGGGTIGRKAVKAAKLGGPAGVFIAAGQFDNSLKCVVDEESNSNFCLGSIEVFDSDTCMVNAAKEIVSYIQAQSCGRCSFCREGSLQMLTVLEDIAEHKGRPQDLELLTDLGTAMKTACLCAFGRAAPDPVLSSIKLFRSEYDEFIKRSPFSVQISPSITSTLNAEP
jgi:NADH-quinone oxidoreductase subunit F